MRSLPVFRCLFTEGLQYRSINGIRSAVSMTHDLIEGIPIDQLLLVKRLLKGVYNSRPPQPAYPHTWKFPKVVDYLANMERCLIDGASIPLTFVSNGTPATQFYWPRRYSADIVTPLCRRHLYSWQACCISSSECMLPILFM